MAQSKNRNSILVGTLGLGALAVGMLAASPILGMVSWPGELASSGRPHVAVGLLGTAVLCLAGGRKWLSGALVALALLLGADVLWTGLVSAQTEARAAISTDQPMARVMFSNVLIHNSDAADLGAWVEAQQPDVLVLTEVTERHVEQLEAVMAGFAHRVLEPRPHALGMVLYSRFPIVEAEVVTLTDDTLSEGGPITVIATLETDVGPLTVAGVHPFPPLMPGSMTARDRQLDSAADHLWLRDGPLVVVGDFNATPWSPALRTFLDELDLHGLNVAATWPVWFDFAGIPIDHALVSENLIITHIETGPNIGSDHRPVMIDVALDQGSPGTP